MPIIRSKPTVLIYTAWDTVNNVPKTNDAANHILRILKDGVEFIPSSNPSEQNSSSLPGIYALSLNSSETDGKVLTLAGKSNTPGVVIIPVEVATSAS